MWSFTESTTVATAASNCAAAAPPPPHRRRRRRCCCCCCSSRKQQRLTFHFLALITGQKSKHEYIKAFLCCVGHGYFGSKGHTHVVVAVFDDMCTKVKRLRHPPPAHSYSPCRAAGHSKTYLPVLPCHGVAGLCSLQGNIKHSPSSSQSQPNAGYPTLTAHWRSTMHHPPPASLNLSIKLLLEGRGLFDQNSTNSRPNSCHRRLEVPQ